MNQSFRRFAGAGLRQGLMLLLTLTATAMLSALLTGSAPGIGMDERQLDLRLSERSIDAIRSRRFVTGVGAYLRDVVMGDWGVSISLGRPVRELVRERGGLTLKTLGGGLTLAWTLALGLSLILEDLHWHGPERAAALLAGGLLCLPAAMVALLSVRLDLSPALALATVIGPRIFRYVRNILAAWSRMPYVLAARARGAAGLALVCRHICIPAAPELLALGGISAGMAIGVVIPVETVCGSPGVGQLVWLAAMGRDLPVLIHLTVLVAAAVSGANLVCDALRAFLERAT